MGSVAYLAERLEADLYGYLPELYKNPLAKLAVMVSAVIEARSCNLMEIAARLPIKTQRMESRYAWIERFLSADTIDDRDAMEPFADEVLTAVMARGETIVVSLDQTNINNTHGVAMMSVRVGERALPLWRVITVVWKIKEMALKDNNACKEKKIKQTRNQNKFLDKSCVDFHQFIFVCFR